MKNNFAGEIAVSVVLVLLLVALFDPMGWLMPMPAQLMAVALFVAAFAAFATFMWREHAVDERESLHRLIASRAAFLAGAGILVAAIVVQSFSHDVDPFLPLALGTMVIAKAAGLIYGRVRK